MGFFVGAWLLVAMALAVFWLGRWILGPIDRAAKLRQAPARISIGDLLCLFVVVQLPLTLVSRLRAGEETEVFFWLFTFLAWVVAPIIWIACAISLSRAGVTSGKHRLVFMGLILPIVYYGLTPFVMLIAIGGLRLWFGEQGDFTRHWWLIVGWVCMGVALIACGRYTNWLIRETSRTVSPQADREPPQNRSSQRLDDAARGQ